MAADDDRRAAAGMLSNLSGFLISACLAMLAIEGALFAFVLGNRVVGRGFFIALLLALVAFVFSIVCGGWGITRTAESLAGGRYTVSVGSTWFSAQAVLAFVGLLCFGISALLSGQPRQTEIQALVTKLEAETRSMKAEMEAGRASASKLAQEIEELRRRVERAEHASTGGVSGARK